MPTPQPVAPVLVGPAPDPAQMYANIKPIRYRYVMAYLHDVVDKAGVLHHAGEVMDVLPMTQVNYGVGFYGGTEMSGQIYLPTFYLDEMPHPPLYDFERIPHPDTSGVPLGSKFECGNRAIYVMRNEEVVWGGVLWTRSYSSGSATMSISAMSWDAYIYYRLLRQSVVFLAKTNVYTIWYAVLRQALCDFTWTGPHNGTPKAEASRNPGGDPKKVQYVPWTGISGTKHANAPTRNWHERWPNNNPNIELPPRDLLWKRGGPPKVEVQATVNETFRGYDMGKVGEVLQQWADTETIASSNKADQLSRFEYRVVCWFDSTQQIFRQRYVFGEMTYDAADPNTPTGILRELIGANTRSDVDSSDNKIIFDFPGHISQWSLNESMEDAATRVIVTDGGDKAAKHTQYSVQDDLLKVPSKMPPGTSTAVQKDNNVIGSQGWLLYDMVVTFDTKDPAKLAKRATRVRNISHVPEAAQISDLAKANTTEGQRASHRSTDLSVTLYQDPTLPSPNWQLGDWATFAIEDPFYGGKMYLQRRIIGYTVSVIPDQESDYSHESIQLELTDDTKIAFS